MTDYSDSWYDVYEDQSRQSAREIEPLLLELTSATSVADVGCGRGAWLSVFRELGVEAIRGYDGEHVNLSNLLIDPSAFRSCDLAHPPQADQRFDLALCLEVAEHVPEEASERLIQFLTSLAPIVAFSAAIPLQGGAGHVNEQWPLYWAEKFEARGYKTLDCIRPKVWNNDKVLWTYAQNLLLFAEQPILDASSVLTQALTLTRRNQLSLVHPSKYSLMAEKYWPLVRAQDGSLHRRLRRRLQAAYSQFGLSVGRKTDDS